METLKVKSTPALIAARLREAIENGTLVPGQQLHQEDLSSQYGVSRSPLREALRQLEAEGLIDYQPNRGATVMKLSVSDIEQIYEIRRILETAAIRFAVPKMTEAVIGEAKAILARMRVEKDPSSWVKLHQRFHMTLYSAGGRPRLLTLIADNYVRFALAPNPQERWKQVTKFSRVEHMELIEACEKQDVKRAEQITIEHLRKLEDSFLQTLT